MVELGSESGEYVSLNLWAFIAMITQIIVRVNGGINKNKQEL